MYPCPLWNSDQFLSRVPCLYRYFLLWIVVNVPGPHTCNEFRRLGCTMPSLFAKNLSGPHVFCEFRCTARVRRGLMAGVASSVEFSCGMHWDYPPVSCRAAVSRTIFVGLLFLNSRLIDQGMEGNRNYFNISIASLDQLRKLISKFCKCMIFTLFPLSFLQVFWCLQKQ